MAGELQPLDEKFPIVREDRTPTLYFIRWAQQKQIDIAGSITAQQALEIIEQYLLDHQLQEGSGIQITPSGNLSDMPTIAADVQEILDQITTTQGSILYRNASDWVALAPGTSGHFLKTNGAGADPSWAAAGGGGSVTYVQSAGKRINGSAVHNAVLGATPTVGNILFYIGVGFNGGTWLNLLPTGFTTIQSAVPVANQFYRVGFKTVVGGDGTTWGYTTSGGANDVGGFVIVEVSGCNNVLITGQASGSSGSVLSSPCFDGASSYFTITAFERDNTGTYSSITGASLLFDATGGGVNHPAVFAKSTTVFGIAAVTMSSGATSPIAVQVKISTS